MRAAVRLLAQHPQDLSATAGNDFALLLDRGRVNPILRVAHVLAAGLRGGLQAIATLDRFPQHRFLRKAIAAEVRASGAEVPGQRLFDDDVLAESQRLNGQLLVRGGRRTQVHYVDARTELFEGLEGADALVIRERVPCGS